MDSSNTSVTKPLTRLTTKNMDPADRASEIHERLTAATKVAAAYPTTVVKRPSDASPDCVDCGHEIPADRLAAVPLTERCVLCQGDLEDSIRRRA